MQESWEGERDRKLKEGQQRGQNRARRSGEPLGKKGGIYTPPAFLAVGENIGPDYPVKFGPDYPTPFEKRLRTRTGHSGTLTVYEPDISPNDRIIRTGLSGR